MGQGFPATLFPRCREKKQAGEDVQSLCHYGLQPHSTSHPCAILRNSQYTSFESAVGVFHLCGFDGSQPRQGENHSGCGILKWKDHTSYSWVMVVRCLCPLISDLTWRAPCPFRVPSGDFPGGLGKWLRSWAPNAGGLGWIPGQGTRSHMPQPQPGAAK